MQHATYMRDGTYIHEGASAYVLVMQHPTCSPGIVRTSEVLSYNPTTGVFTTRNTTYTPHQGEPA